ncbi:MAG: transglycosylase domain-containing protein [Alphaproteobacteria bacterium]|nr:transglycosylase domain-containing protein [Alphaproteobacteria bacterium]
MKQPSKKATEEKKPISWKWRAFGAALAIMLAVASAIALYVLFVFLQMPSLDSMLRETRSPSITFVDKDGYEIRSYNKIMGSPVSVENLPPHVWQAIIAIEDKRFFNHGAVDMRGFIRSVISNMRAGSVVAGGSTITQQTAKNIFLSHQRTMSRKIQELILAYWLENRFSKEQILDLYMNRVSLVRGLRGIDAAARDLFLKPATELTLAESAQIAAMLKAPTTYSPVRAPEKNIARTRVILVEMVRQKYITIDEARAAALMLYPVTPPPDTNVFRYWTDYITDEIASRVGNNVAEDLIVYTTLDGDLQESMSAVVRRNVANAAGRHVGQGAAVAMERGGAIRAMVGGTNYQESQFNRVLAHRQPGSTFKLVVFLVALEVGMNPSTIVNDSRFSIGDYNPRNLNERYHGDMTLSAAFAKSVNSVPLKLAEKFGVGNVLRMAARLGVGGKLRREYSTILGASEMTLLNLSQMYDVVWNDGYEVYPYGIEKIMTPSGRTVFERVAPERMRILAPHVTHDMQIMLADVLAIGGTGRRAASEYAIGGKTGTSSDYRDAWFVGATEELTIGVWVGNDDFSPMDNITGGTVPAEIFREVVDAY